jgi:hypothetical protein
MSDWIAAKNYRSYYWRNGVLQLKSALAMLWYGVLLNRGHHSRWRK